LKVPKIQVQLYFHHTFIYLKHEYDTYFHVLVFLKNVPKCILIHAIIQYYAMKSNIFLLLIIKVKYIHDFNVLNLSLWILSTKKRSNIHGHTLPCFHPFEIAMLLKKDKIWCFWTYLGMHLPFSSLVLSYF